MNKVLSISTIFFFSVFMNSSSEVVSNGQFSAADSQTVMLDLLEEKFEQVIKIERSASEARMNTVRRLLDLSEADIKLEYQRDTNGDISKLRIYSGKGSSCASTQFQSALIIVREAGNSDCAIADVLEE